MADDMSVITRPIWTSDNPKVAEMYGKSVYPLLVKGDGGVNIDVGGKNWKDISADDPVTYVDSSGNKISGTVRELAALHNYSPKDNFYTPKGRFYTDDIASLTSNAHYPNASFDNIVDIGMNFYDLTPDEAILRGKPSNTRVDFVGSNVRSPTARFDPRLADLANIGAGIAAPIVTARMIEELLREDANNEVIY